MGDISKGVANIKIWLLRIRSCFQTYCPGWKSIRFLYKIILMISFTFVYAIILCLSLKSLALFQKSYNFFEYLLDITLCEV